MASVQVTFDGGPWHEQERSYDLAAEDHTIYTDDIGAGHYVLDPMRLPADASNLRATWSPTPR